MTNIEDLKRQIDTSRDLLSVVKTMKALAAVSIRQYEKAVESLAEYNRTVEMGLQVVLRTQVQPRSLRPGAGESFAAVVFGSDWGMCGQFNEQIASVAIAAIERQSERSRDRRILVVGLRAAGALEAAGLQVDRQFAVPSSASAIATLVREILLAIDPWQERQAIDRLVLFYNQSRGSSAYRPYQQQILPLDRPWLDRLKSSQWPTRMLPQFTLAPDRLFSALIREYCFVSLFRACAQSLASENASRLASMQIAEKNIGDRLEDLNVQYQYERQNSITSELLDIVSGFEALRELS
ncbi:F0F1 ATP synthase subunit gamma [Oxynema aestuarii]|jgi:F-type H+-transporting ATPase subunit gamma|uniref:F0F1 ATP synthase subunit gamma n=1 Tax=Oxynema aestuarii AP17 TaxID=2064643 RepID=A0A6H1TTG4_9CYAN|nr:F0F1 ATP synthase subunit gamma [Oxynema aestuarii]QIZ69894.1 F0F1 ATP synthase subunit gamma [Oxynema aestuarii AP17]RMH72061.1 MAG: F0F1 ATP synthase subunit gamma [Cyanobacteria bacterium J007]